MIIGQLIKMDIMHAGDLHNLKRLGLSDLILGSKRYLHKYGKLLILYQVWRHLFLIGHGGSKKQQVEKIGNQRP